MKITEQQLRDEVAKGTPLKDIAIKYNISREMLGRYVKRYGLAEQVKKNLYSSSAKSHTIDITEQELRSLVEQHLLIPEMATKLDVSETTIKRRLKDLGIELDREYVFTSERYQESRLKLYSDDGFIKKIKESNKKTYDTRKCEDHSGIMKGVWLRKEYRDKQVEIWKNQNKRDKQSETQKKIWEDDNLRMMESELVKELWKNPEYRENESKAQKARWADPEYKDKQSAVQSRVWENPEYRRKQSEIQKKVWENPELLKLVSESSKELWKNEEYKNSVIEALIATWDSVELRLNASQNAKELWKNEEYRNLHISVITNLWKNEEYRNKVIDGASERTKELWKNPEYRRKLTESSIKLWENKEFREKMAIIRQDMPRTMTKPHQKVCNILDTLNIKYITEYAIGPWNFDIFIPNHNLLIEVQGTYWHEQPKTVRNDKTKSTYVKQYFEQFKINYIWEHECLQEAKIIEKIKYWLGITKVEAIEYKFDDVVIKRTSKELVDPFLYDWHYQHHGSHGIDFGGFIGDTLICVARFTAPHRQEVATSMGYKSTEVMELSRLCVHPKYQKHNLLTWFLSRCEKDLHKSNPDIKCLVSFADTSYNHTGAIYKAANWEEHSRTDPDYHYECADGWVMNKKTLWNHAKKMGMSESDYAVKYGYIKVKTKEKIKFIKKLN